MMIMITIMMMIMLIIMIIMIAMIMMILSYWRVGNGICSAAHSTFSSKEETDDFSLSLRHLSWEQKHIF